MTGRNDGGPAFSATWKNEDGLDCGVLGMSLRDWFAGQALAGLHANPLLIGREDINGRPKYTPAMAAEDAYDAADAMLAERARQSGGS